MSFRFLRKNLAPGGKSLVESYVVVPIPGRLFAENHQRLRKVEQHDSGTTKGRGFEFVDLVGRQARGY